MKTAYDAYLVLTVETDSQIPGIPANGSLVEFVDVVNLSGDNAALVGRAKLDENGDVIAGQTPKIGIPPFGSYTLGVRDLREVIFTTFDTRGISFIPWL